MEYAETEEQRLIRKAVREIGEDYEHEYWKRHVREQEFPEEYWQDLADGGWLGVTIPEEYGGEGYGMLEMAMIIEELSRQGGLGGLLYVLTPVFGGIGIQRHGTDEQRQEFLPAIASGEIRFCMALTEPDAGLNTLNIDTSAELQEQGEVEDAGRNGAENGGGTEDGPGGDTYEITGQKTFISGVENADYMLLIARTTPFDSSNPTHGLSLFIVPEPADRQDIELTPIDVDVPWFEVQYQVHIDGLTVPAENVLGEVDGGLYLLWDTLNTERIAGAASAIGGGLRAVDLATEYAQDRSIFGQPIGGHQAIQHPIAASYAELLAARELTYKAACMWDNGEDAGLQANAAKHQASQAAVEAADHAVQTHGGNGFTAEYEVWDLYQNLRTTETIPVSNEMVLNFIAEHHLGLPRSY